MKQNNGIVWLKFNQIFGWVGAEKEQNLSNLAFVWNRWNICSYIMLSNEGPRSLRMRGRIGSFPPLRISTFRKNYIGNKFFKTYLQNNVSIWTRRCMYWVYIYIHTLNGCICVCPVYVFICAQIYISLNIYYVLAHYVLAHYVLARNVKRD